MRPRFLWHAAVAAFAFAVVLAIPAGGAGAQTTPPTADSGAPAPSAATTVLQGTIRSATGLPVSGVP
jgi:hypothetical protein